MSRNYKATGINLKSVSLGEADRLVTILTPEFGLVRAVAPGTRKHNSRLRGRSELFVVNQLLIVKGRSLDKITQAETVESYPGLSRELGKLAAGQYLAEIVLCLGLSEQPQAQLYELLKEHLRRIEQLPDLTSASLILAYLAQGVFHLLAFAGIAPQVHACCLTQHPLEANFTDPHWQVGFSINAGGIVKGSEKASSVGSAVAPAAASQATEVVKQPYMRINTQLKAVELALLQQLGAESLPRPEVVLPESHLSSSLDAAWINIERLLRDYTQYHLGRSIRSANLVDTLVTSNV
ncbi:MAG: DNA repair protein RecO [Cyanobacteria bacterium QS_7_48_42]|nr:MAG: DNA repair protein RecO [Cyanobacteria bacterium QS_7_48_42]PSP35804.1 MAG: DNA repair protein RecO [Cyanobacteria bacterium QS_8_48_54]